VVLEGCGKGAQDGDVDRPDSGGGWVVIGPGLVEGAEPKGIPWPVQPWIREAQSGELLPDGAKGLRHSFRSDGLRAAGENAAAVMTGVDDEEVDVEVRGDIAEEGVMPEVFAESHPRREEVGAV
jgi:hypothetical protein